MDEVTVEFNEENWFELYYRLGFTWNRNDRLMGCPQLIYRNRVTYPRGTRFTFVDLELVGIEAPA